MSLVHPTAIVDPTAQIADDVVIGPYSIIESKVQIGSNTLIEPHVRVASLTQIGESCKIHTGAVLGTVPQDLKFGKEDSVLIIGDRTTIREYATLNRGTKASGKTEIGSDCLIMAYVHIAHDCIIGDHCILANAVNLAGHVIVEDWVSIGGMVPVHQFVRIGQHSFIGGGYRIPKDVPPYILAAGEPLKFNGMNSVGLRRRGFEREIVAMIRRAYKLIYRSDLNVSQAKIKLEKMEGESSEVSNILKFIEKSERGIIG